MRTRVAAVAALISLLVVTACGGGDDEADDPGTPETGETTGQLDGVEVTGSYGEAPGITVEALKAEEQTSVVLSRGDGPEVDTERDTLLHIALNNGADGKELLSSWSTGQPQTIGPQAQLIPVSSTRSTPLSTAYHAAAGWRSPLRRLTWSARRG